MGGNFNYSGNPADSPLDEVRFWIGDTQKDRPLLFDEEVQFTVNRNPVPKLAAAECADHIAAKFAREADVSVGSVSKSFSSISERYRTLAEDLRFEAGKLAGVDFPALSVDRKRAADIRSGDVQPAMRLGIGDNPYAVQLNDAIDGLRHFSGF